MLCQVALGCALFAGCLCAPVPHDRVRRSFLEKYLESSPEESPPAVQRHYPMVLEGPEGQRLVLRAPPPITEKPVYKSLIEIYYKVVRPMAIWGLVAYTIDVITNHGQKTFDLIETLVRQMNFSVNFSPSISLG